MKNSLNIMAIFFSLQAHAQMSLNSLTEKITHLSRNGFMCEKESESFKGSLIQWQCSKGDVANFKGKKEHLSLLKKFSAQSEAAPFLFEINQVIDGYEVAYFPLSGCLIVSRGENLFLYQANAKQNSLKGWYDFYKKSPSLCPLSSSLIEYTPQGFIKFKKK